MNPQEANKVLREALANAVPFIGYGAHVPYIVEQAEEALAATEQVDDAASSKPVENDGVKDGCITMNELAVIHARKAAKAIDRAGQSEKNADIICREIKAAFASMKVDDGMVLPELPEGWQIFSINRWRETWTVIISGMERDDPTYMGQDVTPRAAALAAIAKIGEGK